MRYDFKKQLDIGKLGEKMLLDAFPNLFIQTDGREGDLLHIRSKKIVEVKTDSWSMNDTSNFFMERWSRKNHSGGPWQALEHGCSYYLYQFLKPEHKIFLFKNIPELIDSIEQIVETNSITLRSIPQRHNKYVTEGFPIPRTLLSHLYEQFTVKPTGL